MRHFHTIYSCIIHTLFYYIIILLKKRKHRTTKNTKKTLIFLLVYDLLVIIFSYPIKLKICNALFFGLPNFRET